MYEASITANGKTIEELCLVIERAKNLIKNGETERNEEKKDYGFFFEVVESEK